MNNRKKTDRLFAANPHCHWCGVLTRRITPARGEMPPDDMATFDHLVEGSNVMRAVPVPRPGVLSCWKCNYTRGQEYRRERSAHRRKLLGGGAEPVGDTGANGTTPKPEND